LDEALGLAVGLWRVRLGADVAEFEALAGASEGAGLIAGSVVGHDAPNLDAEGCIVSDGSLEEGDGAGFPSSFITWLKAILDASSMQTWTNSQPMPRLLLSPRRSPVTRWPILLNLPSF
jgi:hypothetical protein